MEFYKDENGNITELSMKNVDTGMGVERITTVLEKVDDNYKSSIWKDIINKIEEISGKKYDDPKYTRSMRIVADHMRAIVILAGDDAKIKPSNTDQGYILRRLIRRMIRHSRNLELDMQSGFEQELIEIIISKYKKYYEELKRNEEDIVEVVQTEKIKFSRTLEKGLKEFDKLVDKNTKIVDANVAFKLYDTYGFPIEMTIEEANIYHMEVDKEGFERKFKEHQEKSRAGAKEKFKGGLASTGEMETKYHTATHLLNAALKIVIDENVHQKGSNITNERMRFDFSCDHKLTEEEKQKVESLVNKWIQDGLEVTVEGMSKKEALESGAECMFASKYPEEVTVYHIGNVSHELCGGPHVKNTKELGTFQIIKEEASSQGVRRIKAILK